MRFGGSIINIGHIHRNLFEIRNFIEIEFNDADYEELVLS
jgi:hypothetical protein